MSILRLMLFSLVVYASPLLADQQSGLDVSRLSKEEKQQLLNALLADSSDSLAAQFPKPLEEIRSPEMVDGFDYGAMPQISSEAIRQYFNNTSPENILLFNKMLAEMEKAQARDTQPVKPRQRTKNADLGPNAKPIKINTRMGFETSIMFIDQLGNPWPIEWESRGDESSFSSSTDDESKRTKSTEHLILINNQSRWKSTNMTVMLKGLSDPLIFILSEGFEEVDFKVIVKVPKLNQSSITQAHGAASGQVREERMRSTERDLSAFLSAGEVPSQATPIWTSDKRLIQAWKYDGVIVLRTKHDIAVSYDSVEFGMGGWRVYGISNLLNPEIIVPMNDGYSVVSLPADVVAKFGG